MSQPKQNLRLRRTQKLLRETLIDLIEERGFDALTVGELTSKAMVSRAAFYRNYQDKYDLVEQIFEEVMSTLRGTMMYTGHEQHPPQVWITFFEHIAEYERLYRALLGSKGSPWFVRKMRGSLTELVKAHERIPDQQSDTAGMVFKFSDTFVPDLVSAMLVEAIIWWLEHGMPNTPTEIATRCTLIVSAVFKEVSTWQ
ncbi:MAG TPA: TetR/AcrR family transcriptional regulator [Phototrophicaceae bacterium]|nr:TetR/AcrR family transcriptional regulator [Phototrophicaceae bacterium]